MKKIFLSIVIGCFPIFPLFAQECSSYYDGGAIQGESCMLAEDTTLHTYTFLGDTSDFKYFNWSCNGGLKKISSTKNQIVVKSTGTASGSVGLYYTRYRDSIHFCVKSNCVEYSYNSGFSIYKTYRIDIKPTIEGGNVIKEGGKYLFSASGFEGHRLSWQAPAALEYVKSSSGNEYITYFAKTRPKEGDSLTLRLSRTCNADTTVKIDLLSEILRPELASMDSIQCLPETKDSVYISVKDPNPKYNYWWEALNAQWSVRSLTENKSSVMLITHGEAGSFILYCTNALSGDTLSSRFTITRQLSGGYKITGDTACLQKGDDLEFHLYPAPLDKLSWTFPQGWKVDQDNPHSNSTFPYLSEQSVSGWVRVETKECKQSLDSIYIYIQSPYDTTAGIDVSLADCVAEGDTAYFRIFADPNVQNYIWTFAQDWQPSQIEINNPYDTLIKVVVGKEKGFAKVHGITCNGEWNMQVEALKKGPKKPNLIAYTGCVNLGMRDTIELSVEPDSNIMAYTWFLPDTWIIMGCESCDKISVITNDMVKIQHSYEVLGRNNCSLSSEKDIDTVFAKGADTVMMIEAVGTRLYMAYFFPKAAMGSEELSYNLCWYRDSVSNEQPLRKGINISQILIKPSIPVLQYKRKNSECWSVAKGVYKAPAPQSAPLSMKNNSKQSKAEAILIQPNPTSSSVEVQLNEAYESLSIFNMEGLRLKSIDLKNKNSLRVDLSDFKAGTYLFRFIGEEGVLKTEKIIKL